VFCLAVGSAAAETLRFNRVSRETIEARLGEYRGTNGVREATLKRLFVEAGCGDHLSEQRVIWAEAPNVICVLPGSSDRVIIVGAHFDRVPRSLGVADNWSGASLLPSLYQSIKNEPRQHTYIFIGFTDEEKGLVGSRFYARHMTREQIAATDAMVNMDTLGLAPTEVWTNRSDKSLTRAIGYVAQLINAPISGLNFEQAGYSTDSESFGARKVPRITVHSLTQKSEDTGILHTSKDKLSAMNLDTYYDTYHLMALYLVFLDHYFDEPETATTGTP